MRSFERRSIGTEPESGFGFGSDALRPRVRDFRREPGKFLGHPVDHLVVGFQMGRHGDEGAMGFVDGHGVPGPENGVEIVLDLGRDGSAAEPREKQQEHPDGAGQNDEQGYCQVCDHLLFP